MWAVGFDRVHMSIQYSVGQRFITKEYQKGSKNLVSAVVTLIKDCYKI